MGIRFGILAPHELRATELDLTSRRIAKVAQPSNKRTLRPPADLPAPPATTACIYCFSKIPAIAKICPNCRLYQSKVKNRLTYAGGLVGLIAGCLSAVTFCYTTVADYYRLHYQRDAVSITYMHYPGFQFAEPSGQMVVSNHGGGDLYLSDVVFEWEGETSNYSVAVSANVSKNSVINLHLDPSYDDMFPKDDGVFEGEIISNTTGIAPPKVLSEAFSRNKRKCISPRFISTNDPQYLRISKSLATTGLKPAIIKVNACIDVVSHRTGLQTAIPVTDVVAMFGVQGEPWCNNSNWSPG